MSPKEEMGVGVMEAAVPGSERKREGQKRRRAAETIQEMQCLLWKEGEGCGEGDHCLT